MLMKMYLHKCENSGYKHLSNTMLLCYHVIISGSRKHWRPPAFLSHSIPPSIAVSLSVCPGASAAILPSFLSLPCVLCFFASSLHQPSFLSAPLPFLPLSIHPTVVLVHYTPPPPSCTSIMLPLLDSILFHLLSLPPSLRLSFFLSWCIMLFLISLSHCASCWVFIIRYTISRSPSFLLCLPCFISSTWSNYLPFIAVPVSLSLSVSPMSMTQCVFAAFMFVVHI